MKNAYNSLDFVISHLEDHMKKFIYCLGLCLGLALTASGCELYLGERNNGRDPGS